MGTTPGRGRPARRAPQSGIVRVLGAAAAAMTLAWGDVAPALANELIDVRLVYVRALDATACPDADVFGTALEERLWRSPFYEQSPTLLVVSIERGPDGLHHGRLHLRSPDGTISGTRHVRLRDCRELVQALAVAASVAVVLPSSPQAPPSPPASSADPSPPATARKAAEPPLLEPPPAGAPPPAAAPADRGAAAPRAPVSRWQLAMGVESSFHPALGFPEGGSLGGGAAWQRLSLAIEVRGALRRTEGHGRGEVDAWPLVTTAVPCARFGWLLSCAQVSAGIVRGRGQGYDIDRAASLPYFGAGARIALEVPLGMVAARARVSGEVPLARPAFDVGGREVWRMPAAVLAAGLDAVVTWR